MRQKEEQQALALEQAGGAAPVQLELPGSNLETELGHGIDEIAVEVAVAKLSRDLAEGAARMSKKEARYLVDAYYAIQERRISFGNQVRAAAAAGEPARLLEWFYKQMVVLEEQVRRALDLYSRVHPVGRWARQVRGIGAVLAAGFLANINIERCNTVGKLWRYAGLDPTCKWEKGRRRPWNAQLKVLCWKAGECFVRSGGFYREVYLRRKAYEQERNERGLYAEQAARSLREYKFGEDTAALQWYRQGKLPPSRIHERAKRYAVKLFLAHMWEVYYRYHYKTDPPLPYPLVHLEGHNDYIPPPAPETAVPEVPLGSVGNHPVESVG